MNGRLIHGLDGQARLVVPAAVRGVEDRPERLLRSRLQVEICIDAVIAEILVIDGCGRFVIHGESRVLDLAACGDKMGEHKVVEFPRGQVFHPDIDQKIQSLRQTVDRDGRLSHVKVPDRKRQPV